MSARVSRTAAVVVASLLGLGAVVAALSSDDGDDNSASPAAAPSAAEVPQAGNDSEESAPFDDTARAKASEQFAGGANSDELASSGAPPAAATPPAPESAGTGEAASLPPIGPDTSALGGAPVPTVAAPSRIVKTAVLTVDVPKGKLRNSFDRVVMAAAEVGGWVQSAEEGDDQATLTIKVPADKLEPVLAQIAGVGKRKSQSIAGEDVGAEYVDLEARLRHWRAQEAVFLQLMSQAKTIPDTIQIQQQLSSIQSQIEQLEGRRRFLDGQTAFSTVRLTLLEAGAAIETKPAGRDEQSTLAEAWEDAAGAALAVLGGTLVVLGVAVPLALIVGVPALIALGYRRRQQRTRPDALPAA